MDSHKESTQVLLDQLKEIGPYISTVVLSSWGGLVQYIQKLKNNPRAKFNWRELFFDLVISAFAGFLTYMLCQVANIQGPMQAILVSISGHMGARAIASFQRLHERLFPQKGSNSNE